MATPQKRKPLDRFQVIRTDDVDDMREAVSRYYGEVRLAVVGDFAAFRAHGNYCQLNDIGLAYAGYGAAVDQHFADLASTYAVPTAAAGSAWGRTAGRSLAVDRQQTLIASPGMPVELHGSAEFEELTVQLDASAVRRTLSALIGAEVNGTLTFEPVLEFANPVNRLWWRLLRFLIEEAETREAGLPLAALGEIEQALIVMFLKGNRHPFSHLLEGPQPNGAPRQVRLAEEYIEAHWNQPISVTLLAQLTNVSARSLFDSFRKSRGYAPMAFVRQVRLRHARRMLLAAEPGATVARVAFLCGFGNLGNFARDYRKAFGELPSNTLKLAPAGVRRR